MSKRRRENFLEPAGVCDGPNEEFLDCEAEDAQGVVKAVAHWIEDMVRYYDSLEWNITGSSLQRTSVFPLSAFHGRPMSTSIENFIMKICLYAKLDCIVVMVAAVYLSRIIEKAGGKLPLSSCTVHRVVLQALTVAAKFVLDNPRSNKVMASFADLNISQFNQLEVKFLCAIQYDLAVSPADIAIAKDALQSVAPHVLCDAPECKKIKMDKADVLQDNSNQSRLVGGIAACNNSESDGVENNYDCENLVAGQQEVTECREVTTQMNTIKRNLLDDEKVDIVTNNYNDFAVTKGGTIYMASPLSAMSPKWSQASDYSTASTQQCVKNVSQKSAAHSMMLPQTMKMSTPERRGNYTLIAVAE